MRILKHQDPPTIPLSTGLRLGSWAEKARKAFGEASAVEMGTEWGFPKNQPKLSNMALIEEFMTYGSCGLS